MSHKIFKNTAIKRYKNTIYKWTPMKVVAKTIPREAQKALRKWLAEI